jgi:hypothetical protein
MARQVPVLTMGFQLRGLGMPGFPKSQSFKQKRPAFLQVVFDLVFIWYAARESNPEPTD